MGIIGIKIDFVNEIKVLGIIGIIGIKVIFVNEIKVLGIIGFKVVFGNEIRFGIMTGIIGITGLTVSTRSGIMRLKYDPTLRKPKSQYVGRFFENHAKSIGV